MSTMNHAREQFLASIENTAHWRARKTVEYAEDDRNRVAAERLQRLAEYIRLLPFDHRIFLVMERAHADDDDGLRAPEIVDEHLSRFGFDEPDDPEAFLDSLADEIERSLGGFSANYVGD